MTQAFNLSQFANKVNTSGQASLTTAVTGTLPIANGGTGITTTPSNGQIPIGNGSTYNAATLTAGTNISITNGSGSVTIAATGGAPTTAQVQSAMAGSNAGDLGTFNFGFISTGTNISAGTNYAGSSINMTGIYTDSGSWPSSPTRGGQGPATVSGTWKAMANLNYSGTVQRAVLFLRVA